MDLYSSISNNRVDLVKPRSPVISSMFGRNSGRVAYRALSGPSSRRFYTRIPFKALRRPCSLGTGMGIGLGAGLGLGSALSPPNLIGNDVQHQFNHLLQAAPDAETYESGIFEASQQQDRQAKADRRAKRQHLGPVFKRIYFMLWYKLHDYVIEPLQTFARFLELSAIFLPVLVLAPMCFFGRKPLHASSRRGATLWFLLLRFAAEKAGATFIKLGQWAALRTDIFPLEMCHELGRLHSQVSAHPLAATKRIVSASFGGMPFAEIFSEFDTEPVGVGAIAQVYIGQLSQKAIAQARQPDNQERDEEHPHWYSRFMVTEQADSLTVDQRVAIKVLHPNVGVKINRDLSIMMFFARCIDVLPGMEWLSLPAEVEQFLTLMRMQLDLRIEGLNLARFRRNFGSRLDIHFPKPYHNFTTRSVLVEEYIHAIPMSRLLSLKDNYGRNLSKEVSDKGLDAFLQMLIIDNFVHADLHPGNMMVRFYQNTHYRHKREYKIVKTSNEHDTARITNELLALGDDSNAWCERLAALYNQGYHAEICFLDVGLVTELNKVDRRNFIDLFQALLEFDGYKAGELMVERSRTPDLVVQPEIFALKVDKLVDRMKERTFTLGSVSIGDLLDQVLGMVRVHHVRMEADFITVVVAILLLEGIGRQLDPDLDLFARFVYSILVGFPTENTLL